MKIKQGLLIGLILGVFFYGIYSFYESNICIPNSINEVQSTDYKAQTHNPIDTKQTQNPIQTQNPNDEKQTQNKQYSFRTEELLISHYQKHGREFGKISKEEYLLKANNLINSDNSELLTKYEKEDGDKIYYLKITNEFLVLSTDGYIRTYFKPDDGIDYYNKQ